MKRYKIQLLRDGRLKFIAIAWNKEKNAKVGDCFIRTINENADTREGMVSMETYSEPMTLDEIRKYVESRMYMLGADIGRCVGISLEDNGSKKIYFDGPISMN